jgi:hypothetical protein
MFVAGFPSNKYKKYHWYLAAVRAQLEEVYVLDSLGLMLSGCTELKIVVSNYAFLTYFLIILLLILKKNTYYHNSKKDCIGA